MRKDEDGNACPATLGEYRDLCAAINRDCDAVKLLDELITKAKHGRDEVVAAADSQMRFLLMPKLVNQKGGGDGDAPTNGSVDTGKPSEGLLSMWVVYASPKDFPNEFVARRWEIHAGIDVGTEDIRRGPTLEAVRAQIPPGLFCQDRHPADEPQIVEVWF